MANLDNAIAIVGMAVRLPGARNLAEYWQNLIAGRDCGRELSREEVARFGIDARTLDDPAYVWRSYELADMDMFDARFFGFSPREATLADPQLRVSLETVYESIEDSGHDLIGKNVGFYFGAADHKYWMYYNLFQSEFEDDNEVAKRIVAFKDFFATQISYKLNLTGPSISLSTACSTGLLATHEACNHLLMYDCDFAIAGGCEIFKRIGYKYMDGGLSSRDGYIRAFDQDASGTVFSSGVGAVVLRRLADAIADGDRIYAVIRSTAVNNDGNEKVGYMAPGVKGQMGVINEALVRAGVGARDIGYVEAHGTGTNVGDPIEINAISQVYRRYTEDPQFCAIGSAKTNLGHLSLAAGIAGLAKVALMLHHRQLVPSLHYKTPNPAIDFARSPFYVNTQCKEWTANDGARLAGISSFGVGGTNVHAIVGEAPPRERQGADQACNRLLLLSAKDGKALQAVAQRLAQHLRSHPDVQLGDLAYTLAAGRHAYSHRCHVQAASIAQAALKLEELGSDSTVGTQASTAESWRVVFAFPGQGSQYIDMGRELYATGGVYRDAIEECATLLQQDMGLDIRRVLFTEDANAAAATERLNRTEFTQLALFITSYAMARQWLHWGVTPGAMVGHSIGEYVAACLAGVFELRAALRLVYHRGRLMQSMAPGAMLSVPLSKQALQPYLNDQLSVAAENAPQASVASGTHAEIEALQQRLAADGCKSTVLRTSHAFHSAMMEPMLEEYRRVLASVQFGAPQLPFVSNLTGEWITAEQATTPQYWVSQLRQPVLFAKSVATLCQEGAAIFLELGPGGALSALLAQCDTRGSLILRSMRQAKDRSDDTTFLYEAVGRYFACGRSLDWEAFFGPEHGCRITLPSYPFQHKSYWLNESELRKAAPRAVTPSTALEHPLLGRRIVSSPQVLVFENTLNHRTPSFVHDHRLVDTVIFPGAGFTEMALAAGKHFAKNKKLRVEEIRFASALMLHENVQKTVQVIATARAGGGCSFEILSKNAEQADDKRNWVLHAKGRIALHSIVPDEYPMPALMSKEGSELLPLSRYYDALRFITFGPSFRPVKRMWIGANESLGWCELPEQLAADADSYFYHPVLLDSAFQVIDGPRITESGTLPVGLKNLTVYDAIPRRFFVHALRDDHSSEEYSIGSMTVFSETGRVISRIEHYLQKQIADSVEFRTQLADVLFETEWREHAAADQQSAVAPAAWLILGPPLAMTQGIRAALEACGQRVDVVADLRHAAGDYGILLRAARYQGIVFAHGLDPTATAYDLSVALLYLVKALASGSEQPRLHIVTSGAQHSVLGEPAAEHSIHAAALWGMGNTITVEHPELHCMRMDVDADSTAQLVEDLLSPPSENQIAYRHGKRHVLRLARFKFQSAAADQLVIPNGPFDIRLTRFGTFDNFTAREFIPDLVNDDEVQIEMHSAALNFKETLYALGMLNPNQRDAADFEFGMEGAGRIKKVGSKVTRLRVGDPVLVWQNGCLRSDLVVNASRVIHMPADMSFQQAACIPTVYLTAYYALHSLARIRRGDRVLIHAAAGGVGQVAVQIAQAIGAEVYATASPGKWEHLRSQGVTHIYSSRTLDFADQVRRDTDGAGVDIVLNSLAGDFITKSFDALAPEGRFIEIGKLDIWSTSQAKAYRPDVHYRCFEVGEDVIDGGIGEASPIHTVMTRVLEDFAAGRVRFIPTKEFDVADLPAAYRYLSSGKNIGKVIVNLRGARQRNELADIIKTDRTYLITGGLGGLGLLSAAWLIERGAKHLVLTGRSAPSDAARRKIDDWRKVGVQVVIATGDVGVLADATRIIDDIAASMPALGGVLHCAGVLQDGVITSLTEQNVRASFAPKVVGTWNLHQLTRHLPLDLFVLFSSVSAIFDGGGQANYAAANAFMDRLAAQRHAQGLPALSVNWGGWAEVGMAAQLATNRAVRTELLLNREEAFLSLERLLIERRCQGTVCKLGERLNPGSVPLLLTDLVTTREGEQGNLTEAERVIAANAGNTLEQNMQLLLRKQVVKVLGLSADDELGSDQEFVDLGVDSLSMTELKNAMQQALGKNLKMASFFANSTIARFARFLTEQYGAELGGGTAPAHKAPVEERSVEFVKLVDSRAPLTLFCVPGLNSNVFDYLAMAEACKDRYCLQIAQAATDLESLEADITKLAASAIERMRQIQRFGPYALVGYSYGGVVCLEMAHQLRRAGVGVQLLMMIDSFPHFEHAQDARFMQFMSALITDSILQPMGLDAERYAGYAQRIMGSSLEEGAAILAELNQESSGASRLDLALLRDVVAAGEKKSQAHYAPPAAIPGVDIHFVRAASYPAAMSCARLDGFLETPAMRDAVYGWGRYVANCFHVTRLAGHHNTLLKKDHVHEVLTLVDGVLATPDQQRQRA